VPCEISRDRDADQNEHITIRIGHGALLHDSVEDTSANACSSMTDS
jgi:hypothetical protein